MRTKVTLVLLFLNVALFFYIFKFERGWRTEHAASEARRRVLGAEVAGIQSLEISGPASVPAISLVKRGDTWYLTRPFDWPANPTAVQRIITDLRLLDHETSFSVPALIKNGQTLADYGLNPPALTLTFASVDPEAPKTAGESPAPRSYSLRLGNKTPDGKLLYLLSPDGENVHVVLRSLADSLAQTVDDFRSNTLFSIPVFEVRYFNLHAASVTAISLRRNLSTWSFETPVRARASKVDTELAINRLNALEVKSFVANPPPEAGSGNPLLRITLEGNNRSETLNLYQPVGAVAATGSAEAGVEYYARMDKPESRGVLFTVVLPDTLKASLDNAQVALRERHLLDFDPRAVNAIALADDSGQPELTLQRLDAPATSAADSAPWQIVRRDARQAPQTQPADLAGVRQLLDRIAALSAQVFLSDAPLNSDLETWGFNRPARTIRLTLAGAPGIAAASVQLRIGESADHLHAYVQVGGADSVYEVDREILNQTRAAPYLYRDRLLRELATGAQITGVKLTDAATQAVVFQQALAPAEGARPASPALQSLLDRLRVLRAAEFLGDHFTPVDGAAGNERPWKYQLDVTIALVGGSAAAQTSVMTLMLGDRLGGTTLHAGSRELDAVWVPEQAFTDALWALVYGSRDPGAAAPAAAASPAAQP
jgi:hypothetical protein